MTQAQKDQREQDEKSLQMAASRYEPRYSVLNPLRANKYEEVINDIIKGRNTHANVLEVCRLLILFMYPIKDGATYAGVNKVLRWMLKTAPTATKNEVIKLLPLLEIAKSC